VCANVVQWVIIRSKGEQSHVLIQFCFALYGDYRLSLHGPASWLNTIARAGNDRPAGVGPSDKVGLPEPFATNFNNNLAARSGMAGRSTPVAPAGFQVTRVLRMAQKIPAGFWCLPNGDVLVRNPIAKANPPRPAFGQVTLLRDANTMALRVSRFVFSGSESCFRHDAHRQPAYVGNNDAILRFAYQKGQTRITAPGEKSLRCPPAAITREICFANVTDRRSMSRSALHPMETENGNAGQ